MNYKLSYGKPKTTNYHDLLDVFSNTKINSIQTSTVPHVEYWKNPDKALSIIESKTGITFNFPELCFEYPTPSYKSNKSSMTDLMIIDSSVRIAIEAKYTEYSKSSYETISDWYPKGTNSENRKNVLIHWKNLIEDYIESNEIKVNSVLPYQFLHRTASACNEKPNKAIVIYQLFYDNSNQSDVEKFCENLSKWIKLISPKNKLEFYVWKIRVELLHPEVEKDHVFYKMKNGKIYNFLSEELVKPF